MVIKQVVNKKKMKNKKVLATLILIGLFGLITLVTLFPHICALIILGGLIIFLLVWLWETIYDML
jgi:hypothetical protein